MNDLFRGTTTLITGASLGIGEQFARQIAARGGHLLLCARSRERLEGLAADLRAAHPIQVEVIDADLSTEAGVTDLLHAAEAIDAPIDHLISNAGFGFTGPFLTACQRRHGSA